MNTEIVKKKQRIEKKYLFICIALSIIELLLFILIRLKVFESMDFSIQNSLQKNYSNNEIPIALTCIYYLNKIYIPYLIIIIVNNFSNIYNIFNLFNVLSVACYISCILKFIFYRVVLTQKEDSVIYYCGEGWNLPSTEMIISVSFFLTLWNCFFNDEEKYYLSEKNKNTKYIFLGIIIIFNIANIIFLACIGYYPFSHLIFSAILGVLIFIFLFKTNIIKIYNAKEFCRFIKKKFELYFLINIILLFLSFVPYIIQRNHTSYDPPPCKSIDGSFYYKNSSKNIITYVDDTFSLMSIFFAHFFMMIGLKIEFCFYYENKIQIFYQYHFGINIEDLSMEKELRNNTGTIVLTAETEWNNTSKKISIIRLILSFILSGACFLPYILVEKGEDTDFSTIFLFKYFCSYSLFTLGIAYLFRGIFRILKLTNEILDSILNDQ